MRFCERQWCGSNSVQLRFSERDTHAYGGKCGRTLEASVQQFHDKLLLLKSEMNTKRAKEIAELRHSFMNQFLNEWYTETSL